MPNTRNTLAGKSTGKSDSAKRLQKNKAARDKKKKYDSEYQKSPDRVAYRVELNRANRQAGTYGNKDGKDMSHTKSGKLVKEAASTNRARNGRGGKSSKR